MSGVEHCQGSFDANLCSACLNQAAHLFSHAPVLEELTVTATIVVIGKMYRFALSVQFRVVSLTD